jgi:ADP-heptose:LPS heptosyltransferase
MKKILIVRFSSVGDIILTEPVVREIKQNYSSSEIYFLTKEANLPLLSLFENITHSIGWVDGVKNKELLRQLKDIGLDLVIDLHNNLRSARVKSTLRVPAVTTKKEWVRRLATVKMKVIASRPSHAINRYFSTLKELDIDAQPTPPRLNASVDDLQWWNDWLRANGKPSDYYVIAAGATHLVKRAPNELWQKLNAVLFDSYSLSAVVLGASSEEDYLADTFRQLKHQVGLVTRENICRAAAILKSARFVVSNDSGLGHLAAAVGTPVLVLFGPTHPSLGFAPFAGSADHYTVNEFCSPCSLHGDKTCYREERYCYSKMQIGIILEKISRVLRR